MILNCCFERSSASCLNMDNKDLISKNKTQELSPTEEISEAGTAVSERYVSFYEFQMTTSSSIMIHPPTTSSFFHIIILKSPTFILRDLLHCSLRSLIISAELNPLLGSVRIVHFHIMTSYGQSRALLFLYVPQTPATI